MNLVAKEFVAAQPDDDPGVLILSQFAGAAQELEEALIVNPFDPDSIADAMHAALMMPLTDRQARHTALREKIFVNTARAYSRRFLKALASSAPASSSVMWRA
jgi:trehalose 6-phosphate synthase